MAQRPKPGDQIEIFRTGYQHWAIYVGDGYVVHLTSADGAPGNSFIPLSANTKKAIVKKEKLSEVVGTNEWKVNNEKDKKYNVRPVREIISSANKCVGLEIDYNVTKRNCEHFAALLRYGIYDSGQVDSVSFWGKFFASVGAVGFGAAYLLAMILNRHH